MNKQAQLDVRNITTGKNGEIFVSTPKGNVSLGECEAFLAQMNFTNVDYQPIGSNMVYAVDTGQSVTLTMTEVVIRDDLMLKPLYEAMEKGYVPEYTFRGQLERRDGGREAQIFRNCIPDGSVDLLNIVPGETTKRPWAFRCNSTPELSEAFK